MEKRVLHVLLYHLLSLPQASILAADAAAKCANRLQYQLAAGPYDKEVSQLKDLLIKAAYKVTYPLSLSLYQFLHLTNKRSC